MEPILKVGQWMADCFTALWLEIGTWGVIGVGIIATTILYRVGRLLKKIFQF